MPCQSKPVQILFNSNAEHTNFFPFQNADQATGPHIIYLLQKNYGSIFLFFSTFSNGYNYGLNPQKTYKLQDTTEN